MQASRVEALKAMPIFGGIRADVLAGFVEAAATVAVAQGEFYFREGDRAQSNFVLEAGEVALLKH